MKNVSMTAYDADRNIAVLQDEQRRKITVDTELLGVFTSGRDDGLWQMLGEIEQVFSFLS